MSSGIYLCFVKIVLSLSAFTSVLQNEPDTLEILTLVNNLQYM